MPNPMLTIPYPRHPAVGPVKLRCWPGRARDLAGETISRRSGQQRPSRLCTSAARSGFLSPWRHRQRNKESRRGNAMTTGQAVQLCSQTDTGSFLVPCYGFDTADQAQGYAGSPDFFKENRIFGPDDLYAPVIRRHASYVPRVSAGFCRWRVSELVGNYRLSSRPIWEVLRGKDTPKPAGAYNVALLVDGK